MSKSNKENQALIRKIVTAVIFALLGFIGNYLSLQVSYGVSFIFGSVFSIIAVVLMGLSWGIGVSLIASSYTYLLWNHPYAIVIFIAEILWIGFALRRGKKNILLIDSFYWLLFGVPLVIVFYSSVMDLGAQTTALIALKQALNGIVNALIVSILLAHTPLRKWLSGWKTAELPSYSTIIFHLTALFLMVPSLSMLLYMNYRETAAQEHRTVESLRVESYEARAFIQAWVSSHVNAVRVIADLGERYPLRPSPRLQEELLQIHKLFPDFYNVFLGDAHAVTVAFNPPVNERGETTIGISFADRAWFKQLSSTLEPVVSDVFMGRGGIFKPIFSISVPIVRNGKLVRFGLGAVNLENLTANLRAFSQQTDLTYSIVDQNSSIIVSTDPNIKPLTKSTRLNEGSTMNISPDVLLWTPGRALHKSVMNEWKDSYYYTQLPIAGTKWTMVAEASVWPMQQYLYNSAIWGMGGVAFIYVLSLLLAVIVSRKLSETPRALSVVSTDIPVKIQRQEVIVWPDADTAEMEQLIGNFKDTEGALRTYIQKVMQANVELEQKVRERTVDLQESESKYRIIFNNEVYAICIFDLETLKLLDVNDAYVNLYGWSREELVSGMTTNDITAEQQESSEKTKQAVQEGTIFIPLRHHRKKDGTVFPVEITGGPYAWKGRKVMFALTHDITGRIKSEELIQRSLAEKTVMLQEIHHRVKNNMQVISSLLNLQAHEIADENVRALFEESKNRIYSMALIHEKLYRSEDLARINFNEYLQNLVAGIADTYRRHDIVYSVEREPITLDVNVGIPCGLIMNELVSNCLKYAFPEGRKGMIKLGIKKDTEGNNVLTVADNGVGFPDTVDFHNTTTLGLKLVNVLSGQIHGKIELSRVEGTAFRITFPETKEQV